MKLLLFKQTVNCKPCDIMSLMLENDFGVSIENTYDLSNPSDEAITQASHYGVMGTPLLVLVDEKGEELQRVKGIDRTAVESILKNADLI